MRKTLTTIGIVVLLCHGVTMLAPAEEAGRPAWVPDVHVVGTLPLEQLGERLPEWERAVRAHRPSAEVVESLSTAPPARIEVLFATWCSDSYDHVPPLLSALRAAANPGLKVELIGLDRDKLEPEGRGLLRNVRRVPTVVVLRDGRELGRIVETPATTMERDVAQLLL
jgi:hypothetical protein